MTRPPDTFGTQYANFSGVSKVEAGTVRDMLPPGDGEVGAWWRGGADGRRSRAWRVACRGWRETGGGWRAANVSPVEDRCRPVHESWTGETSAGRGARVGGVGAGRGARVGGVGAGWDARVG